MGLLFRILGGLCFLLAVSIAAKAEPRLTTEGILGLIQHGNIRTIDDLLAALPKENKAHYALLYRSLSPQHASFGQPRAVLFDESGELVLAFNTDPTIAVPYFTLDILDFDPSKGLYEGHALHFDPAGAKAPSLERNAPLCLQCHASFLGVEPVRRAYLGTVFPGIYGSIGDEFRSSREASGFQDFITAGKGQGRYRYLAPPAVNADGRTDRPNSVIGFLLNRNNNIGLAKALAAKSELKPYRYAILAGLECLGPGKWDSKIEDYLPAKVKVRFTQSWTKTLATAIAEREKQIAAALRLRAVYLEDEGAPVPEVKLQTDELGAAPALKYLVTQISSGDARLRTEIEQLILDGSDGFGGVSNLAEPLYRLFLDRAHDADLYGWHEAYDTSRPSARTPFRIADAYGSRVCPALKTRSIKALSALAAPGGLQ